MRTALGTKRLTAFAPFNPERNFMQLTTTHCFASISSAAQGRRHADHAARVLALCLATAGTLAAAPASWAQALPLGDVVGWGFNDYGQITVPSGLPPVKSIATGLRHSLALKTDGTLVGWGWNEYGLVTPPAGLTGVKAIAVGTGHNVALKTDGTVVSWGYTGEGRSTPPAGLTDIKAIAAGGAHNLALKTDGTVVAWGYNVFGQSTLPAGLAGVKAIAAGANHSLVLKADGTVVAWGYNVNGQGQAPNDLTGVNAIAAGYYHNLALKSDGTVVAWGDNERGQAAVPAGLTGIKAISAGAYHSLALKTDGTVVAWGWNYMGQTNVPAGLSGVNTIAAGYAHNLAANAVLEPEVRPYDFSGFLAPVDNPGVVNHGKAGRTYPLKWQLKDEAGKFVTSPGAVRSITFKPAQCGSFASVLPDAVNANAPGKSGLSIDATSGRYVYNWATPSAPGCYALFLSLDSGQVQQAYFNLR